MLVYRTDNYKRMKASIERQSKKREFDTSSIIAAVA